MFKTTADVIIDKLPVGSMPTDKDESKEKDKDNKKESKSLLGGMKSIFGGGEAKTTVKNVG